MFIPADCGPGTITSNNACVLCAIGSYQEASFQTSCDLCDPGYTTQARGSTSEAQCIRKYSYGLLLFLKNNNNGSDVL